MKSIRYKRSQKKDGPYGTSLLRKGVLPLLILLQSQVLVAQDAFDDWTLIASKDGVSISYKVGECSDLKHLFLTVSNERENTVDVNWKIVIADDGGHEAQFEGFASGISSNELRTANCETPPPTPLLIFLPQDATILGVTAAITVTSK